MSMFSRGKLCCWQQRMAEFGDRARFSYKAYLCYLLILQISSQLEKWLGQHVMMTSSCYQSILGLQTFSQINLRIRSCLSKLDTISKVHSEQVLYQSTISITSDIFSALLEVLLTLYTGTGFESLQVLRSCHCTKFWLIKTLVAPESTRIHTENNLNMSVVSRNIRRYREVLQALRAFIVRHRKSLFSYLE